MMWPSTNNKAFTVLPHKKQGLVVPKSRAKSRKKYGDFRKNIIPKLNELKGSLIRVLFLNLRNQWRLRESETSRVTSDFKAAEHPPNVQSSTYGQGGRARNLHLFLRFRNRTLIKLPFSSFNLGILFPNHGTWRPRESLQRGGCEAEKHPNKKGGSGRAETTKLTRLQAWRRNAPPPFFLKLNK